MVSVPNNTTSARETAYNLIRGKIINLDLKPNEVLNDKELMDQMEMSRTPIREAIIMLSLEHLVVVRPQSGTFIAPIDLDMVSVEQFNRYVLEKEVAELACGRVKEPQKNQYEENIFLYDYYYQSKVPDRERRLMELDNSFHSIAFEVAGRKHLFDWMQASLQHIERIRILSLKMNLDEQIHQDHEHISQAIIAGDKDQAKEWLERHMNRYQDHLQTMKRRYPNYFKTE
jgi:DNA-binding GntR family transcriptional regulator